MMRTVFKRLTLLLLAVVCACQATATTGATAGAADTAASDGTSGDSAASADAEQDIPTKPAPPAPPAYDQTCPAMDGDVTTIKANGFDRSVRVYRPAETKGAGLLYIWHGLGDNAKNMAAAMGAAKLAEKYNLVVVVPDSCCNGQATQGCCPMVTGWSYSSSQENDSSLFDALLTCSDQQLGIDRTRVYTAGFSAGALWSTWLTLHRSTYLAAAAIFSGGITGVVPWLVPERVVPVIDSSGGTTDVFAAGLVNFQKAIEELNTKLRSIGAFVVHCQHQQGHTIPLDIKVFAFDFVAAHTWGGSPEPYADGLPDTAPAKCTIVP